ncbi:hypothetical protein Cgig2_020634 [Carnegiea gigantea]|uniref:Cupin type-1 domain-containing protein n=1 Tax=Carnegiea gigantea TaxID=171969 RepID=A0A9Q1JYZ0_9CARY|nr:hypothetical protein Cgig2_020634 [Carnegiea gigantea]
MILKIFLAFCLLSVVGFCVADLNLRIGLIGYPCQNVSQVVVGNTSNFFWVAVTGAFDATLPGLNGLGLSMFRLDIDVGGVIPIHTHWVSELIVVIEGTILASFIDSDNIAYFKTLNKGDVNVRDVPALAFVSLNSANPGFQLTSGSLFANNLPSSIVQKITLIDEEAQGHLWWYQLITIRISIINIISCCVQCVLM